VYSYTENRVNMEYNVEADFMLLNTCNFRCTYCFSSPATLGAKVRTYATSNQWREGFDATGKTWLIHITGGEPSIYPGFVELCKQLAVHHYLSINSNLSHHSIDDFVEKIDPGRVHFVHASVHYEERQKRKGVGIFIDRIHKLHKAKFNVLVSVVMTPKAVETFPVVFKYFDSHGVPLIPKVMRGKFKGKVYPAAYSNGEKTIILEYLIEAQQKHAKVIEKMAEPPTIDMFSDSRFLNSSMDYKGKMCGSGFNFVVILPDGTVRRCQSKRRLGNILLKNVVLMNAPKPCDTSYCPYFCEKYTSPQILAL